MATEATVKVGVQSAKGTPDTSNLICTRMLEIEQDPEFNFTDDEFEYSCTGTVDRPTLRKSFANVESYRVTHNYVANLYPDAIGAMLVGGGFQCVTTADNPESGVNRHVFTLGSSAAAKWLTFLRSIGSTLDTRAIDNRITSIAIADSRKNVRATYQGTGLTHGEPAGTETSVNEAAFKLLQLGFFTVNYAGSPIIDSTNTPTKLRPYQSHTLTIANPQEEEEGWYEAGISDLTPNGLDITGNIQGLEVDEDLYKIIDWGGAAGTAPAVTLPVLDVNYKLQSAVNISGKSVPYSIEFDFPNCEGLRDGPISIRGGEKIRMNLTYRMVDTITTPATITLFNTIASYA